MKDQRMLNIIYAVDGSTKQKGSAKVGQKRTQKKICHYFFIKKIEEGSFRGKKIAQEIVFPSYFINYIP